MAFLATSFRQKPKLLFGQIVWVMQTSWHKDLTRDLAVEVFLVTHCVAIRYLGRFLPGKALRRGWVYGVKGIVECVDIYIDAETMTPQVKLTSHGRLF